MFIAGSVSAGLSVALGAFGAHALKSAVTQDLLAVFETACRYQMYHALGLIGLAWAAGTWSGSRRLFSIAGLLFLAGTFLFSGSLYLYSTAGLRFLTFITPVGGLLFLAGWVTATMGGVRAGSSR